ncbi:MAG: putative baseplate assembly protein [Azospirillum sp.]|nr:putative baseplate assembly protein [Azospirillum sp.]
MPLQAPDLDTRRYDDLVRDILTLIPRFTPEWTDQNDSDPGMAIAKLHAWSTELQLWALNQVPERNYVKFLQMVGIERRPAVPARTEVSFSPARDDVAQVFVPAGTEIAAAADAAGPIVFETERPLTVLGTPLQAVQVHDGFGWSNETTKLQAAGQTFYPFGPKSREGSALLFGFGGKADFTGGDVDFTVYLPGADTAPAPVSSADPALSVAGLPMPARLIWEYRDLTTWQPAELVRDDTRAFSQSGHIVVRGPGSFVRKAVIGEVAAPLYWLRCRLDASAYERAPRLATVVLNSVPALQATTRRDEVLGLSTGRPNQSFILANRPVVPFDPPEAAAGAYRRAVTIANLRLEIDEGQGFEVWQEVGDFYASSADDPHFTLNRTTGLVQFGDGRHGRIPLAYLPSGLGGNIVARRYRSGGGRRGNVAAGTVTAIQSYLPGINAATNRFAAQGGTEEETVAEAKLRAAAGVQSNGRAVTAGDFEVRALEAGVRRAKALALTHPGFPGARIPGSVTVIVVPDGDQPNPMPNAATLAAVSAHLDRFRLITTELHVAAPSYRKVRVVADVTARRTANFGAVQKAVEARLDAFFSPLVGGAQGTGWPFGGTLFFSDVYRLILDTPEVERIADGQLVIWVDGTPGPFCRDIPIGAAELTYAAGHQIGVTAAVAGGR